MSGGLGTDPVPKPLKAVSYQNDNIIDGPKVQVMMQTLAALWNQKETFIKVPCTSANDKVKFCQFVSPISMMTFYAYAECLHPFYPRENANDAPCLICTGRIRRNVLTGEIHPFDLNNYIRNRSTSGFYDLDPLELPPSWLSEKDPEIEARVNPSKIVSGTATTKK